MSLTPGTRLGPYEIESLIGSGGMGEVYKAHDGRLNRTVAIKRLFADAASRFQSEARAIAAISHPHICQIYDVGPDYLVLEFLQGEPLGGPVARDEAVRLASQIADALDAAHTCGILHRDLKPANVLVVRQGGRPHAKLLDFGVAQLTSADPGATRTVAGVVMGTPAYMSPEQATARPLDARSDVFSFGAVLYELLTGARAFTGDSTAQVLSAVLRDDPLPLQAPPALQQIVKRCLAKDPERRFQTMADVRHALQELTEESSDVTASIAILPFANLSADPEQEYFSDGLADEIITALAKIRELKVIARTSSFAFKGQNIDVRQIAGILGVSTILEGSVRRSGQRIRVTAQLVSAADGSHLWSERFDRQMADVFELQDEIAAAITTALRVALVSRRDGAGRHTPTIPAYEALLMARHLHWQVRGDTMARAGEFYERAIALDPQYGLAHALYADYLFGRTTVGLSAMRDVAPRIRAAALRALELDAEIVDAHAPLALVAATHDYDWPEADRRFALATSGDVVAPLTRMVFGFGGLLGSGRLEEAVEQLERAVQGDPLHLTSRTTLAKALAALQRYGDSEAVLARSQEIDPGFFWTYDVLASQYVARDMIAAALPVAEKTFTLAPWYPPGAGVYAGVLMRTGDRQRAQRIMESLGSPERYGVSLGWALFHTTCGDLESAAESFASAIDERHSMVGAILHSAITARLRQSPKWPPLARLMKLPV